MEEDKAVKARQIESEAQRRPDDQAQGVPGDKRLKLHRSHGVRKKIRFKYTRFSLRSSPSPLNNGYWGGCQRERYFLNPLIYHELMMDILRLSAEKSGGNGCWHSRDDAYINFERSAGFAPDAEGGSRRERRKPI